MTRVYDRRLWKRRRLEVLERDQYVCQIRDDHCTHHAEHVDHIIPLHLNGDPYDMNNLRAACSTCNSGRNYTEFYPSYTPSRRW